MTEIKDRALVIHNCEESRKQIATIRFAVKSIYPGKQDYHWYIGGYDCDPEDLKNTYHVNYFQIKCCPFCMGELPLVEVILDGYGQPIRGVI